MTSIITERYDSPVPDSHNGFQQAWPRKNGGIRPRIFVTLLLAIAATAWAQQTGTAGATSANLISASSTAQIAAGPVVNVDPSMSTTVLQSAISQAPNGATILFAAGIYNITSPLSIPCNNLQITGPVATIPTAILAASYRNNDIFAYAGWCNSLGSIEYLHFENTGAVYTWGSNNNFTFEYNSITNLPSMLGNGGSEIGLFFDGSLNTTLSNVLIAYNTFGDANSCSQVFATVFDEGGYCAGIVTSQGVDQSITIKYNNFVHLEEGIHLNQMAGFNPGGPNSVCISCTLEYNSIVNYHRIGIEVQVSAPTDSILLKHNVVLDPLNSSWGTFAVSLACCLSSFTQGKPGYSPALIFDDNVLIATQPIGSECPPFGVEFWGIGSQGTNSLIQGTFCNGYTWGYGAGTWQISNNYLCGPYMASGGTHISNEEHTSNGPALSANALAASCYTTASTAPTISPAGGSFSGSQVVTLSDAGSNTGIWYTTDGSPPVPGSGTAQYYTGPITITGSATVQAVGMWGAANQPVSYPSGYGYSPSNVVSATFAAFGQ